MIVPRRCNNLVAAAKSILTHDVRTHVCIGGISEIAVRRAADEAGLARWVEPPFGRAVRNDDRGRTSGLLLSRLMVVLLTASATATASTTASTTASLWLVAALAAPAVPAPTPSATVSGPALTTLAPLTALVVLSLPVAAALLTVFGPIHRVIRLSISPNTIVTRHWRRVRCSIGFRCRTRSVPYGFAAVGIAVWIRIGGARLGFRIGLLARATAAAGRTSRFVHCVEKKDGAELGLIGGRCSYVARSSRASWSAVYCTRSGNPCPVPRTAGGAHYCIQYGAIRPAAQPSVKPQYGLAPS